jgi:hypothetical protein
MFTKKFFDYILPLEDSRSVTGSDMALKLTCPD